MKKTDLEIAELIPISVSVKMLDEQFQHLRGLKWNLKEDEDDKEEDKE